MEILSPRTGNVAVVESSGDPNHQFDKDGFTKKVEIIAFLIHENKERCGCDLCQRHDNAATNWAEAENMAGSGYADLYIERLKGFNHKDHEK